MLKESYLANIKNLPEDSIKIIVIQKESILSPSKQLLYDYKWAENKISWQEYMIRFYQEMSNQKCISEMQKIKELAKEKDVYLICYEKEYPCHRFLLIDIINRYI